MQKIRVEALVQGTLEKVWKCWNDTESIKGWAFASADWECPYAENDLRIGGRFLTRMSARDKSSSFDFSGTYTDVREFSKIQYTMDKAPEDAVARTCEIVFEDAGNGEVRVIETFDSEDVNDVEMQRAGWQSILNNFKKFVEAE
jgi:uncharacterized protein YndB with AHSA1/START domain